MSIKQVEFTLPATPPSLNVMLRMHWLKRRKEQEKWNYLVLAQWLNHNKFVFLKPVEILYTITFRKQRVRDLDNYIGGTKYITDALKRTFLLRDDAAWVRRISVSPDFIKGRPQSTVSILEAKDNGSFPGGLGTRVR